MTGLSRDQIAAAIGAEERERREESATRQLLKQARNQIADLEAKVDVLTALDGIDVTPPDWLQPPKQKRDARGIACLMLSDLHLDEVVNLEQMGGHNKYDRQIAELRYRTTINKTIRLARDHISGITYDGIVVWLGGDNVSGEIHDELKRTNAAQHTLETLDYWVDPLAAGLLLLAEHFGHIRLVCQVGNHGRTTKKPEAKNAVRSSFDWSLYRNLWRLTRTDSRFSWNISESIGVKETVYGTTYWFEHGDAWKGGDQIAGPVRPIMFGRSKRLASDGPFDVMLVGDKHTYATPPGIVMNGSMVGYSEFSRRHGFPADAPKQAFWVETPENGPGFSMPIMPCDPKTEGW